MEATHNLPGIGIKPLLSLRRHYRVSLLLFLVVVLAGLPVVFIKGKSLYSAESVFQVAPRYMKNLEADAEVELQSNSQYREFVNHLQNTVTRYDVLTRALDALRARGIAPRPPALTQREYIERLQRTIQKFAIPDTYMVRIHLDGGADDRPILHEIVNAVTEAFLETSKAEQIFGSSERYNVLAENERVLNGEIAEMDIQRAQLAEQLGLTTFSAGVTNPYDALLAQLREKLANAVIETQRADATYRAFKERGELPTELGRSLRDMRLGDLGLIGLRTETNKRIEDLTNRIAGLTAQHPSRGPAEKDIAELRERLAQAEARFDRGNVANFEARLAATLDQHRLVEQGIRSNVAQMESQASRYAQLFQTAMHLTRAIEDKNERIQRIRERMNYLETESSALGFVRLVTAALPAEMPMGVGKTKLLLALLVAATGAALGAPIAIDLLDRRIRSVNDAERLLGIPAAGWQIRREDLPTRLYADEQARRFAAALGRNRSRTGRNLFAFTSVRARGGTTSCVLDTARTLAGLGSRVLVVEANAFTPSPAYGDARPGLSDLLIEGLDARTLVAPKGVAGATFDQITVGRQAEGGLRRLDRLRVALESWSQGYDFVLFDLAPILLSADAEMLVEMIGQVFLVVGAESATKGEISRARRLLQKIDPAAAGLYVNAVPLFRGSGYLEQSIIETVTREPFSRFDAGSRLGFQRELWLARWSTKGGLLGWLFGGFRRRPQGQLP